MRAETEKYLDDINQRLQDDVEQANYKQWVDFMENRFKGDIFTPMRSRKLPPQTDWPKININDALKDAELMILREFKMLSDSLSEGQGNRVGVRCNYGVGILASLFGCEPFVMPYETDTLPAVKPLASLDKIKAIVDKGVPDIYSAAGGKTFETAHKFMEVFEKYPQIKKYVILYHPDTQGPIDLAELIWGSDIFYAFYDHTELLSQFFEIMTQTIISFLKAWFELVPSKSDYYTHWRLMFKGKIMIREDSLMNLSPQIYKDFIMPYDQRILDEFGGGAVHFCGRGEHYIHHIAELKGLTAINMTQPEYNNLETIFKHTVDKKIKILSLSLKTLDGINRNLHGQVHCEL